jgi:hypothetical protein
VCTHSQAVLQGVGISGTVGHVTLAAHPVATVIAVHIFDAASVSWQFIKANEVLSEDFLFIRHLLVTSRQHVEGTLASLQHKQGVTSKLPWPW